MELAMATDLVRCERRTDPAPPGTEQRPHSTVAIAVRGVRRAVRRAGPRPIQQDLRRHREPLAGGDQDIAMARLVAATVADEDHAPERGKVPLEILSPKK
eukprot:6115141-Heterocapsa_arctica.AAC.1